MFFRTLSRGTPYGRGKDEARQIAPNIAKPPELPKRVNTRFQLERVCVGTYAWRA
jgi:hypothetical protein